jgi:pimeloyl-ACP methyl ester carboxylesterase
VVSARITSRVSIPAAALVLVAMSGEVSAATQQQVNFKTEDGVSIGATLYLPSRPAPAVILLHPLTRSREDWRAVGQRLAEAGIAALAIDLRGHGASDPPPVATSGGELTGMSLDIKAARAFLAGRREVVQGRVGLLGASVGANLAVTAAAADPSVRTLALLSPGLDYRGIRTEAALNRYGGRPVLMVGSSEDNYVMISMRRLSGGAGAGTREQLVLDGAGHGTAMVARRPELIGVLVDWFRRTLL